MDELQDLVDEFDRVYNTEREHQGLPGNITPQEAWNHTLPIEPPVAPPTALEIIAEASAARLMPPGEATRVVRTGGRVSILAIQFRLGAHYLDQTVHIMWNHKTIDFYDEAGTLISTHAMPPTGTRSVGHGKRLPTMS